MANKDKNSGKAEKYQHQAVQILQKNKRAKQSITKKSSPGSWFSRLCFFLAVICSCLVFYFTVVVSSAPRSIPFVTQKIQQQLNLAFNNRAQIKESLVSFTRYGTLNIKINQLKIAYQNSGNSELESLAVKNEQKFITVPKLELEFSLLNLFLLQFKPSKIRIIDSKIMIDNLALQSEGKSTTESNLELSGALSFLSQLESGVLGIRNLEVENAQLLLKNFSQNFVQTQQNRQLQNNGLESHEYKEITVKKAAIRIKKNSSGLNISLKGKISLAQNQKNLSQDTHIKDSPAKPSINSEELNNNFDLLLSDEGGIDFESKCQFGKFKHLSCSLQFSNLVVQETTKFYPNLFDGNDFKGALSGNFDLSAKENQLENIKFSLRSEAGSLTTKEHFPEAIEFQNLLIEGNYQHNPSLIALNKLEAELISNIGKQTEIGNPKLSASASFYFGQPEKNLNLSLSIKNLLNDEVQRFWPLKLSQKNIRSWYLSHIKGGKVEKGEVKMSLTFNEKAANLRDITAKVDFTDFNLAYDKNFPEITEISGTANFGINSMEININKGRVLESGLSNSKVAIKGFSQKIPLLEISGESSGNAADGLKHAHYDENFSKTVEKFLNGKSQNKFQISIPLAGGSTNSFYPRLVDCFIAVESQISGLKNNFIAGSLTASIKKNQGELDFVSEIGLTQTAISSPELGINKPEGVESTLKFILDFNQSDRLAIHNFYFLQKSSDLVSRSSSGKVLANKQIDKKILAEVLIDSKKGELLKILLQNQGFSDNNYSFTFNKINLKQPQIKITGTALNLSEMLKSGLIVKLLNESKASQLHTEEQKIRISLGKIQLQNNKKLNRLSANLVCNQNFCSSGQIQAGYLRGKSLEINIGKTKERTQQQIDGYIQEIGYLAESLDLSKLVNGGDVKFKFKQKLENSAFVQEKLNKNSSFQFSSSTNQSMLPRLDGEITLENPITIFENESVKKLSKNTLFSKIRDQIFASEKTIFTDGKANMSIIGDEVQINSLILNNFKIGVSAKGKINFRNGDTMLSGMIIPGYVVNNLFGTGKIPLIGSVVKGLLTGGEEGGGVFGLRYEYLKKPGQKEGEFTTNKVSAFVPTTIQNLFN